MHSATSSTSTPKESLARSEKNSVQLRVVERIVAMADYLFIRKPRAEVEVSD
jgi:hypothetical protein